VRLDPEEGGKQRQRVALRCRHGKFLQLNGGMPVMVHTGEAVNEPGVALIVDEPTSRRLIEVTKVLKPNASQPIAPAVDYRSSLSNPTTEVLDKEFVFTHEKATVGTWSNEFGISLSVGTEVEFGSKALGASAKISMNITTDYRRTWGGSRSETQTVQDATTVRVPPRTALEVHIVAERHQQDVPFEYVLHRWDLAGEPMPDAIDRGVYRKVDTLGTTVRIEKVKPIQAGRRKSAAKRK
jgi:hypothetical protein